MPQMMNRSVTIKRPPYFVPAVVLSLAAVTGCAKPSATTRSATASAAAKANAGATDQSAGGKSTKAGPLECATNDPDCKKFQETAILAGGCFWGMEELLRAVPGMLHTEVGYSGGNLSSPTYEDVKKGNTGHAESVRVVFDTRKLSYNTLLERWFFRMHDPTTENRQGNDRGTQYRSAIFYASAEQRKVALEVIKRVEASGKWSDSIVTEVTEAGPFTLAEDYHQDYLQKTPGGYTCHYMRE